MQEGLAFEPNTMKKALGKKILRKREKLSEKQVNQKSRSIIARLSSLNEFRKARSILFYVSFKKEVDTHAMIKKMLEDKKKSILVPFIKKSNPLLQISQLKKFDDLQKGSFGILEPKKEKIKKFDLKKIDIVLVPGIAFDKEGHRIGYGFGYYDRFLEKMPKKTIKIGLAFDLQIVEKINHGKHDVPLDVVVTERRILRIN